jgi:hypothetical protein
MKTEGFRQPQVVENGFNRLHGAIQVPPTDEGNHMKLRVRSSRLDKRQLLRQLVAAVLFAVAATLIQGMGALPPGEWWGIALGATGLAAGSAGLLKK